MTILKQFVALDPSRLETIEKLEQLRSLENGIPIQVVVTDRRSIGVDRPHDIKTVSKILAVLLCIKRKSLRRRHAGSSGLI